MKTVEKTLISLAPEIFKPPINFKLICVPEDLGELFNFFEQFKEFCLDIETTIEKDIFLRKIRTIQVGVREKQIILDLKYLTDKKAIIEILEPVLNSNQWLKIGHNIEYDILFIKQEFGIKCWNVYDTYLAEKVILCGKFHYTMRNFWGLDNLVGRYLNISMDKSLQKSFNLEDDLTEEQLFYCACDVRFPQAIKNIQQKEIKEAKLERIIQIENDCVPASVDLQFNGLKLIPERWNIEVEKVKEQKKEVIKKMDELLIPVVGLKGVSQEELDKVDKLEKEWKNSIFNKDDRKERREAHRDYLRIIREKKKLSAACEGDALINYESNPQLLDVLSKLGFKKESLPDTNDQTLKKLEGHVIIDLLREFRGLNKIITTYAPYVKFINPITGRIHQNLNQLQAESGRMSSTSPNLQNIPKEANWRTCFEAEQGNKLVIADFAGQEIGVMAECSQEKVWVDAIKQRWDIHSVVAEIVFGQQWKDLALPTCEYYISKQKCKCPGHSKEFPDGSKSLRDRTKAISFGICYGMQEKKLANELKILKKEARELLHKYYASFKDLITWLEKAGKISLNTLQSKTLLGRIRYFKKITWEIAQEKASEEEHGKIKAKLFMDSISSDKIKKKMVQMFAAIEREGRNSVIQGSSADMLKIAIGAGFDSNGKPFLWHFLYDEAKIVNVVHDEVVVECADDIVEGFKDIVVDCMVRAAGEMVKSIPFGAEAVINQVWSK